MIMGKGMHWMSKTLELLARLRQAGPAGQGEAAAARRRAEEFGREERGGERGQHTGCYTPVATGFFNVANF